MYKINQIFPIENFKLVLEYTDGVIILADFIPIIQQAKEVFQPLQDPNFFAKVSLDKTGRYIYWEGEIEFCADALRMKGEVQQSSSILRCDEVINTLRQQREEICAFQVTSLALFGSVARDEAGSDIDLLVEFSQPVGLFTLARLKIYLEQLLGCAIDLSTPDSIKPYMRDLVIEEAKRVF